MQKIRLQILLTIEEINALQQYQIEHHCKNISQTITHILLSYSRLHTVISKLEAEAWKKEEGKKKQVGTDMKPIIVRDVKKSTVSKVILEKNTSDTRKHEDPRYEKYHKKKLKEYRSKKQEKK